MIKEIQQRNNKIVKLHAKGKTQQEIADVLGLTRQRIQQIERELGLRRDRSKGVREYTLICQYSGKKFTSRNKKQKYASREFFYLSRRKYKTPAELKARQDARREKNRLKAAWYYYNVLKKRPDFKEIVRRRNQKYAVSTSD